MNLENAPFSDLTGETALRRKQELQRFRRRSDAVHFWRRALPVLIVAIAGLLFLGIAARSVMDRMSAGKGPTSAIVRMVNPRFYGRDSSDRAFVVGAAEASRDMRTGRTVTLSAPSITLDADGKNPTHVQASTGVYREDLRSLVLKGEVELKNQRGYAFSTPEAVVDTSTGLVSGKAGVRGDGPLGHVVASSYGVYDQGERIVMRGDVHAHIVQ